MAVRRMRGGQPLMWAVRRQRRIAQHSKRCFVRSRQVGLFADIRNHASAWQSWSSLPACCTEETWALRSGGQRKSVILGRKRVLDKVPTDRSVVFGFRPLPSPSPHASEWCRHAQPAPTGKARACRSRSRVAFSVLHDPQQWIAETERMRHTDKGSRDQGIESRVLSPNKSFQRAGTDKVLARGRALTLWAGAVRPRASTGRRAAAELSR